MTNSLADYQFTATIRFNKLVLYPYELGPFLKPTDIMDFTDENAIKHKDSHKPKRQLQEVKDTPAVKKLLYGTLGGQKSHEKQEDERWEKLLNPYNVDYTKQTAFQKNFGLIDEPTTLYVKSVGTHDL